MILFCLSKSQRILCISFSRMDSDLYIYFELLLLLILESFFISVLADGISLEFERQNISSSYQDSS